MDNIAIVPERRRQNAAWVAREIIPHEHKMRAWLLRRNVSGEDSDELIQDAYCRLAMLDNISHIDRPVGYFFFILRNLLLRQIKRRQVVSFETVAEIGAYRDEISPSPEQETGSRRDYDRMLAMVADLPEPCREIVKLRKIEGWSQKSIADHLGMTVKAVEKQIWVGVKTIRAAWIAAENRYEAGITNPENGQ